MARKKTSWYAENEPTKKRGRPGKNQVVEVDDQPRFSNPLAHLRSTESEKPSESPTKAQAKSYLMADSCSQESPSGIPSSEEVTGGASPQPQLSSLPLSSQKKAESVSTTQFDEFPGEQPESPPGYASQDDLEHLDQGQLTALGKSRPAAPRITKVEGCMEFGPHNKIKLTQKGLDLLEDMAAEGKSKASIARALGVSINRFDSALNEMGGDNPIHDAWQMGKGRFADETVGDMRIMSGKGNVIAGIWLSKSEHGKRDDKPVQEGAKHVHIHMPESASMEQYQQFLQQQHEAQHLDALAKAPPLPSKKALPALPVLTQMPSMPDFVQEAIEKAKALSGYATEAAPQQAQPAPAQAVPANVPSKEAHSGEVAR